MDLPLKSFGECTFLPALGEDNCDDGFLDYKWNADWDWKENNFSSQGEVPVGTEPAIQTADGYWHYPTLLETSCIAGEKRVPCPAKIALPAYSVLGMSLALVVIILVYYFLFVFKKSKKKKVKKKGRK
jgi:hypothetical protein